MKASVIDAYKNKNIVITNILKSFFSSYTNTEVFVVFYGYIVRLIVDVLREVYKDDSHIPFKDKKCVIPTVKENKV